MNEAILQRIASGDRTAVEDCLKAYGGLVWSIARKMLRDPDEAEDVVQETVIGVAKKMGEFRYDPTVCSFRGWLLHVTRLRIQDQFRKRLPTFSHRKRATATTSTLERIPDTADKGLEAVWAAEWEKNIVDVAMTRVKGRVRPEHYQMFYLNAVKEIEAGRVASTFGVSTAQVYLVKHRVARLIKQEVKSLERKENVPL